MIRRYAGQIRLEDSGQGYTNELATVYAYWTGGVWRLSVEKAMKFSELSVAKVYLTSNETRMQQSIKCSLKSIDVFQLIRKGAVELS